MDEDMIQLKNQRQTVDPLVDEQNKTREVLLKKAMLEFGFKIPLAFAVYNQIRFYEEFGKLTVGMSVVSKETLADQFGVSVKQIESAFNNLTNKYKLGSWVDHQEPVYRNVKRTWVSNERLNRGTNYYSVIPQLLQRNSTTITAEQLATDKPPLSESKKKVSIVTNVTMSKARTFGNKNISLVISHREKLGWSEATKERWIISRLLKRLKPLELIELMKEYEKHRNDPFMPSVNTLKDFEMKLPQIKSKLEGDNYEPKPL